MEQGNVLKRRACSSRCDGVLIPSADVFGERSYSVLEEVRGSDGKAARKKKTTRRPSGLHSGDAAEGSILGTFFRSGADGQAGRRCSPALRAQPTPSTLYHDAQAVEDAPRHEWQGHLSDVFEGMFDGFGGEASHFKGDGQ